MPDLEKINNELFNAHMVQMGFDEFVPDYLFLRECSLADLIAARPFVEAQDKARKDGITRMVCDDRFTAALYTALHFLPEDHAEPEPIVKLVRNGRVTSALFHIRIPTKETGDE